MDKSKFLIKDISTAKEALELINDMAVPNISLFVQNKEGKIAGALTEGDVRRGLLKGKSISDPVNEYMNTKFRSFLQSENNYKLFKELKTVKIRFVPLLDKDGKLFDIIDVENYKAYLPATAILMAGGLGERLKPLTDNIPKPLLKVGDKAIIDYNISSLNHYGITEFFIALRYKSDLIKEHINSNFSSVAHFNYLIETEPRGTAGALSELKNINSEFILLMNSDLLTNVDFSVLFEHLENTSADMVIATIPYYVDIPYAIFNISENDNITSITEKPRYTYYANAGIYLMRKSVTKYIPDHGKFDATDFVELLIKNEHKVVSQPLHGYWLDIGRPEDFEKAQNDIKYINFS